MTLPTLAQRAGLQNPARVAACQALLGRVRELGLRQVRVAWGDLHGGFRGKTLVCGNDGAALADALDNGVGMVSTVLLKDTSDRTAFPVFEPGALDGLPGFGTANNLLLLPDPASFQVLPWAPLTGWLRAETFWEDGSPVSVDPRRVLQAALAQLQAAGYGLRCGLEVELHIYRIVDGALAADQGQWPGPAPAVQAIHPGHGLLSEDWADRGDEALAIVRDTALGLHLPLRSLEIELGPSQVEAVFGASDALTAADQMLLLRNGVRQALRRAGYHATFMCKPPLAGAMASGWHLHQSLVNLQGDAPGCNAMALSQAAPAGTAPDTAAQVLSPVGRHWLAGLLAHAHGMAALCAPTAVAYSRYQGSLMAPRAALWGRDNRGALLRVVGQPGDTATRIENRLGEPLANPYLCIAAQVLAGLDGLRQRSEPGPAASANPYTTDQAAPLPDHLAAALDAMTADAVLCAGLGAPMVRAFTTIKRQELNRRAAAADVQEWDRRELFARY